jgi:hypothetical protein
MSKNQNESKTTDQLIDFTELVSAVPGEGLEQLVRAIGQKKNLSPAWAGRGADSGKDLFFTEALKGTLSQERVTWLVSCKDKSKSNDSVSERDLPTPGIKDKLAQHKANGFLLVTTTTASTAAKSLIDALDKRNGGDIHTLVWDASDLTSILLEPSNHDLIKQFFPKSYERVKGLTTLEGAILAFREQIPSDVLNSVLKLLKPYSSMMLKGSNIWPYDTASANVIDRIVSFLLVEENPQKAAEITEDIEYDAFLALIKVLKEEYSVECLDYLKQIVFNHSDSDVRFNAAQFIFEQYEISGAEQIELAQHLDGDAIEELFGSEVSIFIEEEISINSVDYNLHSKIDATSSNTIVDSIIITYIEFNCVEKGRIDFRGEIEIGVELHCDGESMGEESYPGEFAGYIDEHGMYLKNATVDVSCLNEPLIDSD